LFFIEPIGGIIAFDSCRWLH